MGGFAPGGGLPSLPSLPRPQPFLPNPGGGTTYPTPGTGPVMSGPVNISLGGPGGVNTSIPVSQIGLQQAGLEFLSSPLGYLFGSSLLRLAFFILGLIFIIMGLYMLKQTRFIIKVPLDTAKAGAKAAVKAASAAGEGAAAA